MKVLLTPGGLNEAVIRRLEATPLWRPHRSKRVLICVLFTGDFHWTCSFMRKLFQEDTACTEFSPYNNSALEQIDEADVFYMGGASPQEAHNLFMPFSAIAPIWTKISTEH